MSQLFRKNILQMNGYTPGEQPQGGRILKLNTNENPYPPSPKVLEALQQAISGEVLRKYPDPTGRAFRETAAKVLSVSPEGILIGNGSDDILTILTRAFVPEGGKIVSLTPSYTLYRTLAEIQGASFEMVPFTPDWQLPDPWPVADAQLTFVPNPNSPSGTMVPLEQLNDLAQKITGALVIDEAYVDFAESHALALIEHPNVIVTRTLSKSYSLAGIRFGCGIARPSLIGELLKVKDSYNCDALSLVAATAALEDQAYLLQAREKIIQSRNRLERELTELGFDVIPSQANFVWAEHPVKSHRAIYEELKRQGILIRYMSYPNFGDGLRVSVGSEEEMDHFLSAMKPLVKS